MIFAKGLATSVSAIASTSFVILIGVITLFPTLLKFFVEKDDLQTRVQLINRREYRFLKRLVQGKSLWGMLATSLMFLTSDIIVIIFFLLESMYVLEVAAILTLLALFFIFVIIVITLIQSGPLKEDETKLLIEYGGPPPEDPPI